jgi:outer membrane protein insertion porin family
MRTRLTVLAVLASILLLAVNSYGQRGDRPTVSSLRIEGNTAFPSERIAGLMAMRPGGFLRSTHYSKPVFQQDLANVLAFYDQNGYLNAKIADTLIQLDSSRNEISLALRIEEGPLTRLESITVLGNTVLSDSTLRSQVKLKPGAAFDRFAIEDGILDMLAEYADTGYLECAISPEISINQEVHLAMVDLTVTERRQSTISNIRIKGNEKTNASVVLRELSFKEGDIVDYSELLASQRRLYLTGLFSSVFVKPLPVSGVDSTRREILVDLKENLSGELFLTLGYGSVEKVRGKLEMSSTNVAGTARRLGIKLWASGIAQSIMLSATEPRTFGSHWQTDLNVYGELQQEPGYDLSKYGSRLAIGRRLWTNGRTSVTYRFENGKLSDIQTDSLPLDFRPQVRSLIFTINNDTRNDLFDPTRGTFVEWTAEVAGGLLKGNNSFVRSIWRAKRFWQLGRRTVLASSLELGVIDAFGNTTEIPINERFYAGGPTVLRSFGYQQAGPLDHDGVPLGGNVKLVWNLAELRRGIYKMLGAVVFVDIGNVWSRVTNVSVGDMRGSIGLGIRASTPIGIVRLDYAVNPDVRRFERRDRLYFSMGHAF